MAITLLILIILIFITILCITNTYPDKYNQNFINSNQPTQKNDNKNNIQNITYNMISIEKIEECAKDMRRKENLTIKESIYFSISSLCSFILKTENIKTSECLNKLKNLTDIHYPEISVFLPSIIFNQFDLVEHIVYNANIIIKKEHKTKKEANYLTICALYDDLIQKNNQKGINDLIQIIKSIYPELLNEITTYIAWNYEPNLKFKKEFNKRMKKRHHNK